MEIQFRTNDHRDAVLLFKQHFSIGSKKPDMALLRIILSCYSKLPYENLSKIINHHENDDPADKIRLPEYVISDHAEFGLGGTCFALSFFLHHILKFHGFENYIVMADMRYGPNTHCALMVTLHQCKYLVDPGYLLNEPMSLDTNSPRKYFTEMLGVELQYHQDEQIYHLYTFNRQQTKWRYQFKDFPIPSDQFAILWKSSFQWNGMRGLVLSRNEKGRMIYAHKNFMRETTCDGKKNYNIKHNYHQALKDAFGIHPEYTERAMAALEANLERDREMGLWIPKKNTELFN